MLLKLVVHRPISNFLLQLSLKINATFVKNKSKFFRSLVQRKLALLIGVVVDNSKDRFIMVDLKENTPKEKQIVQCIVDLLRSYYVLKRLRHSTAHAKLLHGASY